MMRNKLTTSTVFLLWLLILQQSFESCFGGILCLENERQALLHFKQHLIVPSNRLLSWNASQPDCCDWAEIVCDDLTGHVKELHLDNPFHYEDKLFEDSMLQGKIKSSLLDLKHLHYLDLSNNDFGGIPIPKFFSSLVSLTYLNLSDAGFGGLIPHQLANLTNLHYLSIRGDDGTLYVKNLHWLYGMSSLVHLDLQFVNLSASSHKWLGIINSIPSLQELHLVSCVLSFIPSLSTVNFTSLSVLDLSNNNFNNSMPKWILSLNKLKSLDLSLNFFGGPIPNGLSNLSSLAILNLAYNDFISPLPRSLFELPRLVTLSLSQNHFTLPSPIDFQNLTSLRDLELSGFNFSGSIPEWVYRFPHLESLDLTSCNLRGEIPAAIQNLSSLISLDLSNNKLEGTIPNTMTSLCNLQTIYLGFNKLSGNLSQAVEIMSSCSSRNLMSIILRRNKFSGGLTDEIGILENLHDLDLSFNLISGCIPESLFRLSSLAYLTLSGNKLVGNIPPSLGILSNLEYLRIGDNKLEGFFSEVHFKNLINLRVLDAPNNNLTLKVGPNWAPPFQLQRLDLSCWSIGPKFPSWLQRQKDLEYLNLFRTGISDSIPSWFSNFTFKSFYLNLSHNQIGGEIPGDFGIETRFSFLSLSSNQVNGPLPRISPNISELDLSNNSFSGPISNLLCNPMAKVNDLRILHLGSNHLSGEIPNCWMHWKYLRVINLENNNLRGKIPSSIAQLPHLEFLHLRNNSLFGEIPATLKKCRELLVLDLGFNSLTGKLPKWLSSFEYLIVLILPSNKLEGGIPSELCRLRFLHILNLAGNNLFGSIPACIQNFTAMSSEVQSSEGQIATFYGFIESARVITKGNEVQYDRTLKLVTNMDISNNNLSGDIPQEITALLGLRSLNLSRNNLTGEIPTKIGDMQVLESIDLSRNKISGRIPLSMSTMHFLSYINLSCNNLSGEIPLSTQLQSFNSSSFAGNELCGPPLAEICGVHAMPPDTDGRNDDTGKEGTEDHDFYLGMVIGFVVGFWGIFAPLLYSRSWRISYYRFLSRMWCKLCSMLSK